ncbi:UDP-N-acetylglucosamine diphosphorylase/glucosamine-1-phosphate N-acetyltransferase [Archaeoglobus sulfaticallidus PM70-1]|uniref:Bifunctional protein GlmU n=1 Tax=Archaeoglobus sulfaticallidus PM70-1 TaxID=387631 RepID=N0BNP1_9EURY|nr:bifunctional sugar-1-phosphate nucleotidylyltransferase/acetyltransferase [Archaeoglobus sulfaticallidus]AGK61945.1 UDP-N-acetylglucosamine diphosphorylase/glucosamine-1-phosphate N-acetyltransferase [Archaeoglobus sulfaticallidus PM70-1]
MQAVILSAGEGTRMRPLTYTRPKVMIEVANKPILAHLIEELKKVGVDEVILVVGYYQEKVREYFGKTWNGVRLKYSTQTKQLGTADALRSAEHYIEDDFLMLNGDTIVDAEDLKRIIENEMTIGVNTVDDPENYGVVVVKDGFVEEIIEKPEKPVANTINAGIYHFTRDIFDYIRITPKSVRGEYEITDTINLAIKDGVRFSTAKISGWIDASYPWDLLKINELMLSNIDTEIDGVVEKNVTIKGNVVIGEGSIIKAGTYIEGPVVIGKNCEIGPNCYIRAHTSIGNGCKIGAAVEVKNSIVMNGTKIPHHNYIGDSVIGENCNFGAGTKVANLKLDEKEIEVYTKDKRIKTGRKKLGAIIGDNVKTGINASINAGAMIGNNCFIAPNAYVDGWIDPYTRVF